MRQRVLVGWQVFDNQCQGASGGRQMCPEPGPLHRHTAGVRSRSSRTSERRRREWGEKERERGREFLHLLRVCDGQLSWEARSVWGCSSLGQGKSLAFSFFFLFFFLLLTLEKSVKCCWNVKHNMGDNQRSHSQAPPSETSTLCSVRVHKPSDSRISALFPQGHSCSFCNNSHFNTIKLKGLPLFFFFFQRCVKIHRERTCERGEADWETLPRLVDTHKLTQAHTQALASRAGLKAQLVTRSARSTSLRLPWLAALRVGAVVQLATRGPRSSCARWLKSLCGNVVAFSVARRKDAGGMDAHKQPPLPPPTHPLHTHTHTR